MISLPDFREKQILLMYPEKGVSNELRFLNDNIVFLKNGKVANRASCHKVFAVFIAGDTTITSGLMKNAKAHGVSLFFLNQNFKPYAAVCAEAEGNYLLRMAQYKLTESEELLMAKRIVMNKIANQLVLLKSVKKIDKTPVRKRFYAKGIEGVKDHQALLGVEGSATRDFFGKYFSDVGWYRRMPRVKPDECNFLMDVGYTLLFNFADSLLRLFGFDTYKGVYHKLFFERKSLACDVVEPFRCIIDRKILSMFNLKQVDAADFRIHNGVYSVEYQKSQPYAALLAEAILEHKEEMYRFIHGFYRHMMDRDNPFPEFKLKR